MPDLVTRDAVKTPLSVKSRSFFLDATVFDANRMLSHTLIIKAPVSQSTLGEGEGYSGESFVLGASTCA